MHIRTFLLIGTTAFLATTGCASKEEWQTWKEHPSHFASGEHLTFSIRNREGSTAHVTRQDIAVSRDEGWWGKPITVSTEQILER
ncbi:MAG: hypothetical protein HY217_04835 [Candidatus Rokubacteria bacterium]|nr:hypothetical protein [Candidatus Rokubacteria bacterium]